MNFLYPGFLFALFTIAIPVIIHLFNFRKFKKVYFSNVAFLKEIKEQHSSREKLKNLLILISRILALIFLVFAFARPYISSENVQQAGKTNIVSIYIDNSYSMEAVNKEGNLLDEAKRRSREIARSFPLNTRFQLLTNDFEGQHQRLLQVEELVQAIDKVKISGAGRTLQQVLNRQQNIFTGSGNRYSYLISDFQTGFAGTEPIHVDPHTGVYLVRLTANALPNVAVDSVWLLSPVHQPDAAEKVVVRLKNYGDETAKNIPLTLSIHDQQKAISNLSVAPGKTQNDTLSFSGLKAGWQKGRISIKDFPLTFDDSLHFSFLVSSHQNILSINGARAGKYLPALFNADPYFKLTEMPEQNINYSALTNFSLIVLNGLTQPSSGLVETLQHYVLNGGTVVIFPDLNAGKEIYSPFLTAMQLPAVSELSTAPLRVSGIELKSPLFKDVFESLPKQLDLPQIKRSFVYKVYQGSNRESLLHLPANASFFARYPQKNGVIYLAAGGLSPDDNNLAEHPVFVPLMYKIAFSAVREQLPYYTILKDNLLEMNTLNLSASSPLKLIADHFEVIPDVRQSNGKTILYMADQVKIPGFYELKLADSVMAVMAFNDNRTESDMHYDDASALKKIIPSGQVRLIDPLTDLAGAAAVVKNTDASLWKLCLILSLIFLAVEILLARFYKIKIIQKHEPLN